MNLSKIRTLFLALPLCAAAGVGAQTAHNTLSTEESASGYQLLFNGTNLTGWRGWNSLTPPNTWTVVAESTWNVIRNTQGTSNPLITADSSFQNFDLKYEYWIPSEANSGLFIRYNFYGKDPWGGNSGPETQIAALNNSDGTNTLHRNGTCYDMFGLNNDAVNWDKTRLNNTKNDSVYHQFRIVAFNNRVAHYGNGVKLLEYDMTSSAYNTRYTASKYKDYPTYKTVHPGGIYLQHHGEYGIRFRNLKIKKLTQSPWAQNSVYLTNPADSASGLKSALPFNSSLFPTAIAPAERAAMNRVSARVLTEGGDYSLLIDRAGDYLVRVDDLQGRNLFQGTIRNAAQVTIPGSAFSGGTRVLRLLSASGTREAFSQLIAPVR
jgi:hypothetical protein